MNVDDERWGCSSQRFGTDIRIIGEHRRSSSRGHPAPRRTRRTPGERRGDRRLLVRAGGMVPPPLPHFQGPLRGPLLLPRARRDQPPGPPQYPERLVRRRDNESSRRVDRPQPALAGTRPQGRSRELRRPLREGVRRLAEPARLGREPFPLKEVFQGVRSPGPAPSRTSRWRREAHETPEYPQTETIQNLVAVIHPAARLLHEHALCPPHAVPVNGEDLAGL